MVCTNVSHLLASVILFCFEGPWVQQSDRADNTERATAKTIRAFLGTDFRVGTRSCGIEPSWDCTGGIARDTLGTGRDTTGFSHHGIGRDTLEGIGISRYFTGWDFTGSRKDGIPRDGIIDISWDFTGRGLTGIEKRGIPRDGIEIPGIRSTTDDSSSTSTPSFVGTPSLAAVPALLMTCFPSLVKIGVDACACNKAAKKKKTGGASVSHCMDGVPQRGAFLSFF